MGDGSSSRREVKLKGIEGICIGCERGNRKRRAGAKSRKPFFHPQCYLVVWL